MPPSADKKIIGRMLVVKEEQSLKLGEAFLKKWDSLSDLEQNVVGVLHVLLPQPVVIKNEKNNKNSSLNVGVGSAFRRKSECVFCKELGLNCGKVAGKCLNRPCDNCNGRHRLGRCKKRTFFPSEDEEELNSQPVPKRSRRVRKTTSTSSLDSSNTDSDPEYIPNTIVFAPGRSISPKNGKITEAKKTATRPRKDLSKTSSIGKKPNRQYTMMRKRSECHFCKEIGLNCGLVAGKCPNRPCSICNGRHRHGRCRQAKNKSK